MSTGGAQVAAAAGGPSIGTPRPVGGVDWLMSPDPVAYADAVAFMENRVQSIFAGEAPEAVWLLEHAPCYTAGTSARPEDVLAPGGIPVIPTGRGGRHTYHGPGQRVVYVMLDLRRRAMDVRAFVRDLENWIIAALGEIGLRGERRNGRVGIWVVGADGTEAKIAAIGVRVRRWITYHGMAINVDPDLAAFAGIVPCGLPTHPVTSLRALGFSHGLADLDRALERTFVARFYSSD
jgi:lipoyl(octanoyl) transferase